MLIYMISRQECSKECSNGRRSNFIPYGAIGQLVKKPIISIRTTLKHNLTPSAHWVCPFAFHLVFSPPNVCHVDSVTISVDPSPKPIDNFWLLLYATSSTVYVGWPKTFGIDQLLKKAMMIMQEQPVLVYTRLPCRQWNANWLHTEA